MRLLHGICFCRAFVRRQLGGSMNTVLGVGFQDGPNELTLLHVARAWVKLLRHYKMNPQVSFLLDVFEQRSKVTMLVWKAWGGYAQKRDHPLLLERFAEMWQTLCKIPTEVPANTKYDSNDGFNLFITHSVTGQCVEWMVFQAVLDFLKSDVALEVVQASQNFLDDLPPKAVVVLRQSQIVFRVSALATKIKDGVGAGGALELADFLAEVDTSRTLVPDLFTDHAASIAIVISEFCLQLMAFLDRVSDAKQYVADFCKKYEPLMPAVAQWKFDDCEFLTTPTTDIDDAMAKKIEQAASQYSLWVTVFERLSKHNIGIGPIDPY